VPSSHCVILGLMGSGKTGISRRVGEQLGCEVIDGDEVLEARTGRTARQIADDDGLDALHELEAEIALEALRRADPVVIAPAASVIESDAVRDELDGHVVIWLTGPVEHLAAEAAEKDHRPLVHEEDPISLIRRQLEARTPLAVPLAAAVFDVTEMTKDELAAAVLDLIDR
jgi:shikimate kinase